ncbi:MAG TPA: hypothetical protein PK971_11190, partial [Saprospiraceae bacterium]|nr:hypothetical protein [Saprospiraceae bacterium]
VDPGRELVLIGERQGGVGGKALEGDLELHLSLVFGDAWPGSFHHDALWRGFSAQYGFQLTR